MENETITQPFALTEGAVKKITEFLSKENAPYLRVSVTPGGCSGFMYAFKPESEKKEGDTVIEQNGAAIIMDSNSLGMLKGGKLDYVDALDGAGFKVENPNASSGCGCGKSFH